MTGLTVKERSELVRLYIEGHSITYIQQQTGHDRKTIRKWWRRFDAIGDLHDSRRSGRPTAATPKVRAKIRRLQQRKTRTSARAMARTLQARGEEVSRQTVTRVLHSDGQHPHVLPHQPKQQYGDKARRLRFAAENKERDWSRVWFADEKRFTLHAQPNRKNAVVWTDDVSTVEAVPTVAYPAAVNAYAAFSARGKTKIHLFTGIMTARKYISIMESTLLPATEACMAGEQWTYLQDGDPKHRAAETQQWLTDHVPEFINKDQWPPRSPDLNPIENAWAMVAARVQQSEPHNTDSLKRCIRAAWQSVMTDDYCRTLAMSMPHRFLVLRRLRGAHTHY
jgi:transposase